MWDLTVPGDHDFYVLAGVAPILVHNCGGAIVKHSKKCTCATGGKPRIPRNPFGSRGKPSTVAQLNDLRDQYLDANPDWVHTKGGNDRNTGDPLPEQRIYHPQDKSTWWQPDLTFLLPDGSNFYVNTVDTLSDGVTPDLRETVAAWFIGRFGDGPIVLYPKKSPVTVAGSDLSTAGHGVGRRDQEQPDMQRVAEILLAPEDEAEIFAAARERFPELQVIDSVPWASADEPAVRESPVQCGFVASLWNPSIHPHLPSEVRTDGKVYGPQVGPVVQWIRSLEKTPGVLQGGRWAASFPSTDHAMAEFVKSLWTVLTEHTSTDLARPGARGGDPEPERGFLVGRSALERARRGELSLRVGYLQLVPGDSGVSG